MANKVVFVAAAVVIVIAIAGLGVALTPPPPPTHVTLRLDWTAGAQHTPFYVGVEKGIYTKYGIDLEIIPGSGSSDSVKYLGTKTVDFALVDAFVAVPSIAKGIPLKVIGVYYTTTPIGITWIASRNNFSSPQDLIGKKLGGVKTSSVYQGFQALCAKVGMDPNSVTTIDVGQSVQPLLVGQVDAMMSFTMNQPIEIALDGYQTGEMLISDYGVQLYGLTIATHPDTLTERPAIVRSFLQATQESMEYTAAHPTEGVNAVLAQLPNVNSTLATAMLNKILTMNIWSDDVVKSKGYLFSSTEKWTSTQNILLSLNITSSAVPVDQIFTNDFLHQK